MRLYSFLWTLFFIFMAVMGWSQNANFHFDRITSQNGLPDNWVHEALMDRHGFMWFGTQGGLVRYDGVDFITYRHTLGDTLGIAGNTITDLIEDEDGNLWLSILGGGIDRFDPTTQSFEHFKHNPLDSFSLSANTTLRLHHDKNDRIWIGTYNSGLNELDKKTKKVRRYHFFQDTTDLYQSFHKNSVLDIIPDEADENILWLGTNLGVSRFDKEKFTAQHFPINNPDSTLRACHRLVMTSAKDLWVGTQGNGLAHLDTETGRWDFHTIPQELVGKASSFDIMLDVSRKSETELWVATRLLGLAIFNIENKTFQLIRKEPLNPYSLLSNEISRVYTDKDDRVWVINFRKGMSIIDPVNQLLKFQSINPVHCFNEANNLFNNGTYDPLTGHLIFSSSGCDGLYIFDESLQLKKITGIKEKMGEPQFFTNLFSDSANRIWAFGNNDFFGSALFNYNRKTGFVEPFRPTDLKDPNNVMEALQKATLTSIADDRNGSIWIGSFRSGLFKLNLKENSIKQYIGSKENPNYLRSGLQISDLLFDRQGKLWISSLDDGVYVFEPEYENFNKLSYPFLDLRINCLEEADDGKIWIGSNTRGIILLDGELKDTATGPRFLIDDGLPDENIQKMAKDKNGDIWVATLKGLSKYDFRKKQFFNYNERNGLQEIFLMDRALNVLSNGKVVVGQNNGFYYFDPNDRRSNDNPPQVRFTNFKINEENVQFEKDLNYLSKIKLKHTQNFFSIGFVGLNLSQSYNNNYAYRLEGVDEDWRYTTSGRNYAPYTQVAPGEYIFEVKAMNSDGIWSEEPAAIVIDIIPPWWRSTWFKILALLSFLGFVYFLYWLRIKYIKNQEALKTDYNKKLAEVEMTALRAQMNPHFLFNSLNSIKLFIIQNNTQQASNYLNKFAKLIRLILNNSKTKMVPIQNELEMLELYLQLEKLRFQKRFQYEIILEKGLNMNKFQIPPMIIQPYVENAIWHGLMHKLSGERKLKIRVAKVGGKVAVEIEDNGIGRAAAEKAKSKYATKNKSLGTSITNKRIDIINQMYQTNATVEIIDMIKESTAIGTKVIIHLPLVEV